MRATGGNNSQRNLVVCTYGACDGNGNWNSHLKDPLKNMALPKDEVPGHIIFEVHSYPTVTNLSSVKSEVNNMIKGWKEHLLSKGAPMIVGEWGTSTEGAYDSYRDNLLAFSRYFVKQTKANGIATFHWMGLSDGDSRSVPEFNQPDLKDAIIKGYYGEGGYTDIPTLTTSTNDHVDVYSLSGVCLFRNAERKSLPSLLKRGIYIIGGKIVTI